jgi:hypothetical protein
MKSSKRKVTILKQICNLIPRNLVSKLAHKHQIDKQSRSFTPWSHIVTLIFSQLAHSLSLNDVTDTLRNHEGVLHSVRRATPPSRNGLSHANRTRNADMAEELFWEVLSHIKSIHPQFGFNNKYCALPRRFKRTIYAIDSSTIQLVANCVNWAKHRRRKAAAKCHMQLNLQTFLPQFAIVKAANTHDSTEAQALCANLKDGEIALFDKAYIDFKHLAHLNDRGVLWVTRSKDNISYKVVGQQTAPKGNIIKDELILLTGIKSNDSYSEQIRLVTAYVEVNGKTKTMTFMTNNKTWAPTSICDLYRCRWGVEVFFKQIKQTLQLADFLGHNENAVRWQIWMALLTYVLVRYVGFLGKWTGSFARLFTLLRGVLFNRFEIFSVLAICFDIRAGPRITAAPYQAYLPGFV